MKAISLLSTSLLIITLSPLFGQITERERPKEWDDLIKGGRFADRFLPMKGSNLSDKTWGAKNVLPRFIDNGIEDKENSYWGGNIVLGDDGKYHLFVCGWPESAEAGHMNWFHSEVFHTVSDKIEGPYKIKEKIGKGHNPEIFRLKDGRYVLYVIGAYYIANTLDGPWEKKEFTFSPRGRNIIEGLTNLTFTPRGDGSFLMVCRGGGVWISQDGISPYQQISHQRIYPPVAGEFEDPVVWKDNVQYHAIVNDWLGRIAYYMRSPDGVRWVTDAGEAYMPGISVHADGTKEDWFKYERIKIYQNKLGQPIQANFAVIDVLKHEDKGSDNHSSKNITIPLNPGLHIEWVSPQKFSDDLKTMSIKIMASEGFDPQQDIDIKSLRFGAPSEVDYGRGIPVDNAKNSGKDLILTFNAENHGVTVDEFAPKIIGKSKKGDLIYGYTRLPWVNYTPPILSPDAPKLTPEGKNTLVSLDMDNLGLQPSQEATVILRWKNNEGKEQSSEPLKVKPLQPYEKTSLKVEIPQLFPNDQDYTLEVDISTQKQKTTTPFFFKKKETV